MRSQNGTRAQNPILPQRTRPNNSSNTRSAIPVPRLQRSVSTTSRNSHSASGNVP